MIELELEPLAMINLRGHVESSANLREYKAAKAERVKKQRNHAEIVTLSALRMMKVELSLPLTVMLTRYAPRPLDSDNLASATKAHRDGVTKALVQYLKDRRQPVPRDDSDRLTWLYDQGKCRTGEELLRVSIYETGCVAKWMLRHLPTEPSALERWVLKNTARLDALLVKGAA